MEDVLKQQGFDRTLPRRINRRNSAVMVGIVVVILAAGYMVIRQRASAQATIANIQTVPAQRGKLQAIVNTAGNITPAREATLNFQITGQVKTVDVEVGDVVKAGQVLATLDPADPELEVTNTQLSLNIAQAKLAQTKTGATREEIAAAQAKLDAAKSKYDKLVNQPDAATVQAAKLKLDQAKNSLWSAQSSRDAINGRGSSSPESKDQAEASVLNGEVSVQLAQQDYEEAQKPATDEELKAALAEVKGAESNLNDLKKGSSSQEIVIAQAGVDQAKIALQQAQLKLGQMEIIAPFDGTVTGVNITVGQDAHTAGNGDDAITLIDANNLEINGQVAEVDIPKIKLGQAAQITLDALTDATLNGTVTYIAPAGTVTQGVVNYDVTISLIDPDPAVKPSMTANLNILVDERQNTLMVPNRAIRTQGRQRFVTVIFEGQQIQAPVETGLSNDTMTEITSGLEEGDEVVVNSTTTTQPRGVTGGFGGGPGRTVIMGRPD